jgi:four helix bundle protein
MSVKHFEELEIWREARRLTSRIYEITGKQPFGKDFGLCDPTRRAAVSVMSNIAEGYERGGTQEFINFLSISKGSCGEVRSQLYVVLDRGYIGEEECNQLIHEFKKVSIMISNFMNYLKATPYRGTKYKTPKQKSVKEDLEEMMAEIREKKV